MVLVAWLLLLFTYHPVVHAASHARMPTKAPLQSLHSHLCPLYPRNVTQVHPPHSALSNGERNTTLYGIQQQKRPKKTTQEASR